MTKPLLHVFLTLFCLPTFLKSQVPDIQSINFVDSIIEQYGKFEFSVELTASYTNPYDYDDISVSAVFTRPDGSQQLVDGFFMQDYEMNLVNGSLSDIGDGHFKVRFSPDQIGEWRYQVSVKDRNGTAIFDEHKFECTSSTSPHNNGFVRIKESNYLEFDNGDQLILVGENMAWESSNIYTNYRDWLDKLTSNGGNFIRLWHAHWGLGIEWRANWQGFSGLRKYKEPNGFYQDWLYDYCAEKGIYVMLCLQHHGPVSSQVNPNWNDSPYNIANGGPCQNTWDFFTNEQAIAHTKNRYRYILARWGYSRSIQSWELFNEVNWTDDFLAHQTEIQDWHAEMSSFLKNHDPYKHLVTTSYADEDLDSFVWASPDIDFTQTHFYINSPNIERTLADGTRNYLKKYEKPSLNGEFGLGPNPNLSNADPDGIHLHNGIWGSLFGGGMGTAMTWWWDVYIEPQDLYYHFAPIRKIVDEIPFVAEQMSPATSYVLGAPGDLTFTPNLGWGTKGDESITILENGSTEPASPRLGQYLYGLQWNTQHRSPPTFTVNYPNAGVFTVRTGAENGQDPKISISLNGNLLLDEMAATNESYTIQVPSGPNLIKVDNQGTDWIAIASYTFTGIGSKIDAYTLTSESKKQAAGWVLNNEYNHQFLAVNDEPAPAIGGQVVMEDFQNGDYVVNWYDALTGEVMESNTISVLNEHLLLPIPDLYWDLVFLIDEAPISVNTQENLKAMDLQVYPNPVKSGTKLTLSTGGDSLRETSLFLFDANGRLLYTSFLDGNSTFVFPGNLATGFYWLKLKGDRGVATKGIVVK